MAKGMCSKHYYRVKRGGTAELGLKQQAALRTCSVEDCKEPHASLNYCAKHLRRFKRHGDPNFINPRCNRDGGYRTRHKGYQKEWRKRNWEYYRAYLNARKRRVKQATPSWADLDAIIEFYRNRPEGYHVDHIVPLNGKDVSGLHVIWNLQYLPAKENLVKHNKCA